ncbi:DUF2312 domain-containing protein [Agrobacterium rhizogenes]|nr:DUF2312 domain-containing protein [Rhizobium rhizogenes]
MTDVNSVAADQLKSIVQRVERLESEIADLNAEKSDIYKEARSLGYDIKAIKKVVSKRKLDDNERQEQDAVFDTYWDAVHGTNLVHTRTRENIEEFDAETGEVFDINPRLAKQVVDGMQTEASRSALMAAVDIMIAREEAEEEFHTNPEEAAEAKGAATNDAEDRGEGDTDRQRSPEPGTTDGGRQGVREQEASAPVPASNSKTDAAISRPGLASLDRPEIENRSDEEAPEADASGGMQDEIAIHPATQSAAASQGEAEAPSAEISPSTIAQPIRLTGNEKGHDANTGGRHVTVDQSTAAQAGASVQVAPAKLLRPHCRTPKMCGSGTIDHCHSCKVAMREREMA